MLRHRDVISSVVQEVVAQLPAGSTTLKHEKGDSDRSITVWLEPRSGDASNVIISGYAAAPQSVFVEVGEATTVEVTDPSSERLQDELKEVLRAITERGFVERVWRHEASIIQSQADITFQGRTRRYSSFFRGGRTQETQQPVERRFGPYE